MAALTTIATVALVATAGTAIYGAIQNRDANKERKRQAEVANRIEATKRISNIRNAIARGRVQRAEQEAAGFGLGVSGGTAVAGAVAGTQGGVNSAIAASNQQFTGQQAVAAIGNRAQRYSNNAQLASDIGGITSLFAGPGGQQNIAAIQGLFS